jgi:hypothetical protein
VAWRDVICPNREARSAPVKPTSSVPTCPGSAEITLIREVYRKFSIGIGRRP